MRVGDEVDRQHRAAVEFSLARKVSFVGRIEAVGENEFVVEDEIRIVKKVHDEGQVGDRQISCRLGAAAVEVLVPGVERNREEAAALPFEAVLFSVALPDGRGAAS